MTITSYYYIAVSNNDDIALPWSCIQNRLKNILRMKIKVHAMTVYYVRYNNIRLQRSNFTIQMFTYILHDRIHVYIVQAISIRQ